MKSNKNMIKATLILGESAVREYEKLNEIPSDKWLEDNGGTVDEKKFKTLEEYKAYLMALSDTEDWYGALLLDPEFTEETTDCKHCQQWRSHFSNRDTDVYCPDCGKLIIHIKSDSYETQPCPKCMGKNVRLDNDGFYLCKDCQQIWKDGIYVLVGYPEDAGMFERSEVGYPCFNSQDNGARYVLEYEYILQFNKSPEPDKCFLPVQWPNSQRYFELRPEYVAELCEPIESGEALEDFGSSAIWVPLALLNSEKNTEV